MATTLAKRGAVYSTLGRPNKQEVLPSFGDPIKHYILNLRKKYSGWGARTIYAELKNDPRFVDLAIPSIRSIGRLLKTYKLVKRYDQQITMPDSQLKKAERPHHIWELDAQGNFVVKNIGPIAMINIKDVYSRIYCMAFPNRKKSIYGYSKRIAYQAALRLAFMENGLPEIIQTDHESVFHENKGGSPFPTLFHLWLIGLGISKTLSRIHQPTDQARVERMHQTIERQAIQGIEHANWEQLFSFCQQRRKFLNQTFPCSSLENQTPYAFAQQRHSGRYYHPRLEDKLFDIEKIYDFLQKGKWYRWTSKNKTITLGGNQYYASKAQKNTQVMINFNRETQMLNIHDDKELLLQKIPITGISKEILIGHVFWNMANVQLELPLFWETQKVSTTFWQST